MQPVINYQDKLAEGIAQCLVDSDFFILIMLIVKYIKFCNLKKSINFTTPLLSKI